MRSKILHRQLKGKIFRSKRVTFTAEQLQAFSKLLTTGGHDGEGRQNDETTDRIGHGSGETLSHV